MTLDWPLLITAISTLAGTLGIRELLRGWSAKKSGSALEEKERYKELLRENDRKDDRIDRILEDNRKQREYSSLLRRLLIENGVKLSDLPTWPSNTK